MTNLEELAQRLQGIAFHMKPGAMVEITLTMECDEALMLANLFEVVAGCTREIKAIDMRGGAL